MRGSVFVCYSRLQQHSSHILGMNTVVHILVLLSERICKTTLNIRLGFAM